MAGARSQLAMSEQSSGQGQPFWWPGKTSEKQERQLAREVKWLSLNSQVARGKGKRVNWPKAASQVARGNQYGGQR